MAQSLCPPLSESWLLSPGWGPARPPLPSDRDCSCSPASSPDSWGSVPAGSPEPSPGRPGAHAAPRARSAGRRGARGSRLGSGQRQSASEREKLRMRTLARALHELRRFIRVVPCVSTSYCPVILHCMDMPRLICFALDTESAPAPGGKPVYPFRGTGAAGSFQPVKAARWWGRVKDGNVERGEANERARADGQGQRWMGTRRECSFPGVHTQLNTSLSPGRGRGDGPVSQACAVSPRVVQERDHTQTSEKQASDFAGTVKKGTLAGSRPGVVRSLPATSRLRPL
uniref:uncharacterized protein LOC105757308 n=1 Tax=Odobenus rosmarus divergens TaxID=9708 RepID=UPI00063C260C|nr:PREDICTED: uncharacterized protein LOC105757308 [Odobenus rosmarus divergens]